MTASPVTDETILQELKKLRSPFESNQISRKPQPTKKQTEDLRNNMSLGIRCKECGGWHHKDTVHLDYVGHAALTDRLLDVDPLWAWEPLAIAPNGLPMLDGDGGMWIKLTVCGMTRLGYGDSDGKKGGNATKEVIGDALRNAAMRFGAALELWHKGILHMEEPEPQREVVEKKPLGPKNFARALEAVKAGEYDLVAIKATSILTVDQETALQDAEAERKK